MLIRPQTARNPRSRSRGFSFTEILFAVMILGIGFIMVVAIFPVALQQTENSQGETIGAAVARAGVSNITQIASNTFVAQANVGNPPIRAFSVLRPTAYENFGDFNLLSSALFGGLGPVPALSYPEIIGDVWSLDYGAENAVAVNGQSLAVNQQLGKSVLWPMATQNMIQASDPRYAWVAFYRRNVVLSSFTSTNVPLFNYAPSAQVIVIACQSRARQFYDANDLKLPTGAIGPVSLQPYRARVDIEPPSGTNLAYTITFGDSIHKQRAAEGAFVIVAADRNYIASGSPFAGSLNGHVYRLGTPVTGQPNTWEFAPGYGPSSKSEFDSINNNKNYDAYMIGRAQDPNDPTMYTGVAQDISVYSTFIPCPNN